MCLGTLGAQLSIFISVFICLISLAFISPDRPHTTLKLIIVYGSGLHKSDPSTRMHTCSHAHLHRHVPTLPPSHPTSGLSLSCSLVGMATWFAPLAATEAESMMGSKRQRETIWADINSGERVTVVKWMVITAEQDWIAWMCVWGGGVCLPKAASGHPAPCLCDVFLYNLPSLTPFLIFFSHQRI